jgi:hypothetical protein
MKTKMTKEELAILSSFEKEEWTPVPDLPELPRPFLTR